MSAARVQQLKSLLARVQERRAAPRVREVPAPAAVEADVSARGQSPGARTQPQVSSEPQIGVAHTMMDLRQVSAQSPEPPAAVAPLVLEDVPAKAAAPSPVDLRGPISAPKPESTRTAAPTVNDLRPTPLSEPSPKVEPRGFAREELPELLDSVPAAEPMEEALLSAPSARVEAPLLSRSEPVVRMVSSPRIEAPKTFGELLESSLSLRPR